MRHQLARFHEELGPTGFRSFADLPSRRVAHERLGRLATARLTAELPVQRETLAVRRPGGRPDLVVRVYRPPDGPAPTVARPGLLYLHGGGLIMGSVEADDAYAAMLADATGAVTVSVGYRLAPEHPYPAALDDCADALAWMTTALGPRGIDTARIAVFGASAGGGLAVALALRLRDEGIALPRQLVLAAPMLDDRPGPRPNHVDLGVWDSEHNEEAWAAVLGSRAGGDDVPAYAAPARADDYRGLPPVHLDVGALDLFLHENLTLVRRLADDAVPVELHVHPGAFHGFEQLAPRAGCSTRAWAERVGCLRRAFGS
jgi:acetyl esterase/lipase